MSNPHLPLFFIFFDEYQVLICAQCQHAIGPTQADRHLRYHLNAATPERKVYQASLCQLPLASLTGVYQGIQARQPVPPLAGLSPPQLGVRCQIDSCPAILSNQNQARDHLTRKHRIFASGREGAPTRCYYQALQKNAYLFETQSTPIPATAPGTQLPIHPPPPRLARPQIDEIAAAFERELREDERPTQIASFGMRSEANSFDRHSHYRELLAKRDPGKWISYSY